MEIKEKIEELEEVLVKLTTRNIELEKQLKSCKDFLEYFLINLDTKKLSDEDRKLHIKTFLNELEG